MRTLGYDAENGLISASGAGNTASYAFDAQGRRKTGTVNGATTVFITDADNREVLDYDGTRGAILRWYTYALGPNDVLNQTNVAASTRAALIPDIQGSIIAAQDSGSGALTKVGYLPYGASASAGPFGYTGQRIDLETNGLYYYRARHYSPAWGRFVQADTLETQASISQRSIIQSDNPTNLYAYVVDDPLNAVDPSGHCPWCVAALVGALVGGGIDLSTQLLLDGGDLSQVSWTSVAASAAGGALLSGLGPTGYLLGRGGERAAQFGYSETAGLLNTGETRFGWSFNGQNDVLSFRSGGTHFDIPGISAAAGANPVSNGVYAGAASGGISATLSSTPAYGGESSAYSSPPAYDEFTSTPTK